MFTVYILVTLLATSWAHRRLVETSLRVDLQPPDSVRKSSARLVSQGWMTMPVDHFDSQNTNTFQTRYFYNGEFFGGDGYPIFILVGAELDIRPEWLQGGNMYFMAQENRGYQIYKEHRYYGESLQYTNFDTKNMRFLNVDQALADLAYFIQELKKSPRFTNSKVILYGGSYAANLVIWFKRRYHHLVFGAVASSGPILAKVDFTRYLEIVHEAFLSEGGEQCISIIKQGIDDTLNALETDTGRRYVEKAYRLCEPMNYNNRYDLGYFSGLISWTFAHSVQQARPDHSPRFVISSEQTSETPMEKIGGYIAKNKNLGNECWTTDYESYISSYRQRNNSRAWYYQMCTEFGYFHTAPRSGTVFDKLKWLSVEFYVNVCKRAFDYRFDEAFVYDAVERVNRMFGGLHPNVNNTINIHGNIDPWRALGVYDRDLHKTSPTYNVPRASHCFDMEGWHKTNTLEMTNVQQTARRIVKQWLGYFRY